MSAPAGGAPAAPAGSAPVQEKAGRHREASLYHALNGAGAGNGRSLAQLREAALRTFETSELPVWRRSGFWTTSLSELDLDSLSVPDVEAGKVPGVVTRTLPERPRAGRIVQNAGTVVDLQLDPQLSARGVILCSLEDAFREHPALVEPWYSKRLTLDRHKLEAANAAMWTGGAFLFVPAGVVVEDPFEIVYAIDGPGVAQYARTLVVGDERSEFRVHEYDLAEDFGTSAEDGSPRSRRCTRGLSSSTCGMERAAGSRRCRIGAVATCSTYPRALSASAVTPTATGCRRCSAGISSASTSSWR